MVLLYVFCLCKFFVLWLWTWDSEESPEFVAWPYVYSTSFLWWWCIYLHQVIYSLPTSLLKCIVELSDPVWRGDNSHQALLHQTDAKETFIMLIKHCSPTTVNDKVTALPRLIRVHLPVVHTRYLCFLYLHWNWNIVDPVAYFTEIVYHHFCPQFQFSVLIRI